MSVSRKTKQYPTPGAKLTSDQVRTIRSDYGYGYSQAELARRYWVHPSTISRIVRYKTWKEKNGRKRY